MKIIEYITAKSAFLLDEAVNKWIKEGYIPFENPYNDGYLYLQAMVKYEKPIDDKNAKIEELLDE